MAPDIRRALSIAFEIRDQLIAEWVEAAAWRLRARYVALESHSDTENDTADGYHDFTFVPVRIFRVMIASTW